MNIQKSSEYYKLVCIAKQFVVFWIHGGFMSQTNSNINLVAEIELIKKVIATNEKNYIENKFNNFSLDAHKLLHISLLLISIIILIYDVATGSSVTDNILYSITNTSLRADALKIVIGALLVSLSVIYAFVYRSAKQSGHDLAAHVEHSFGFLKNLTFLSDLVVKMVPLALLVGLGHADYVSGLITIYIADYVFANKVFNLPAMFSNFGGITCVVIGFLQLYFVNSQIWIPLALFVSFLGLSLIQLYKIEKAISVKVIG